MLQNVGWTLQEQGWTDYTNSGNVAEVHDKILEVITAALVPSAAALAIITATITALKGMDQGSSWIKLFSRETQKAKIARFQVGLVEKGETADAVVSLLACLITAENNITQILFYKWREAHASFKANSAKVTINRSALSDLGPAIRAGVRAYQASL